MRHLLLIAHGSRRSESNQEVRALTEALRQRAGDRFDEVSCAFLELAQPNIPSAIDACVASGASQILVVPYFLSAGRHVAKDIPAEVDAKRAEYPRVEIQLADHLGAMPGIADLILERL